MKKVAFIALKIVVIVAVIYASGYIYQAIQTQRQVDSLDSDKPVITVEYAKEELMNGCMEESFQANGFNQRQYCQCMADEVLQDYSVNEVMKMGLEKDNESLIRKLEPYAKQCLRLQGIEV